jgi:hypothetical protein
MLNEKNEFYRIRIRSKNEIIEVEFDPKERMLTGMRELYK